ncbi:MAG: phosphoribosylformylglycinamidine synthase subunit PurQ, partial [Candidatus Eisenbacteria bacterium]|nr:phosphoribosylformylglycinamidine synthase subunit PurQ [Candidatus Eisenbacteria bacterium]
AEGRFATRDEAVARQLPSYIALAYRTPEGEPADAFPWNPNGSLHAAAGITNEAGNVLALMPHPERAAIAAQVPAAIRAGAAGGDGANEEAEAAGPGLLLFRNLVEAVGGSR